METLLLFLPVMILFIYFALWGLSSLIQSPGVS